MVQGSYGGRERVWKYIWRLHCSLFFNLDRAGVVGGRMVGDCLRLLEGGWVMFDGLYGN